MPTPSLDVLMPTSFGMFCCLHCLIVLHERFRFLNVTLACCLMYVIAGMNEGWRDLRRLATAQVKKHTARVKGVHGKGEKHTGMCL